MDLGSRLDDEEKLHTRWARDVFDDEEELHTRWARDVFDIGRGGVRGGLERVEIGSRLVR